jgi:exodeoxyribonuclease VII large subunit
LKLHQLKEKLQGLGWFDGGRKKKLPHLPKRIGVVTSPTGAVIQDILHILTRRFAGFHVILNPVKVQGEGAALEIARAIEEFNRYGLADVLIVGRGGGSIEDLWAFNEEIVAKAIFESRIPIISAVGHETDFTIADWVADVRAPTPSAAAEIVIAEKGNLLKHLIQSQKICTQKICQVISQYKEKLASLKKHPFFSSPYTLLAQPMQKIDDIRSDVDLAMMKKLEQSRAKLESLTKQLELLRPSTRILQMKEKMQRLGSQVEDAMRHQLALRKGRFDPGVYREALFRLASQAILQRREKLARLAQHLHSLNPDHLLQKGYTMIFSEKDHSVILSARDLLPGSSFKVRFSDGQIKAVASEVVLHDA